MAPAALVMGVLAAAVALPLAGASEWISWTTSVWETAYNMSTAARPAYYSVAWEPAAGADASRGYTLRLQWMGRSSERGSHGAEMATDFGVFHATTARVAFEPLNGTVGIGASYQYRYTGQEDNTVYQLCDRLGAYGTGSYAASWYALRVCFVADPTNCAESPRFQLTRALEVAMTGPSTKEARIAAAIMQVPYEASSDGMAVVRLGGTLALGWESGAALSDGVVASKFAWDGGSYGRLAVQHTYAAWMYRVEQANGAWVRWQLCAEVDVSSMLADRSRFYSWGIDGVFIALPVPTTVACDLLPASAQNATSAYSAVLQVNTTVRSADGSIVYARTKYTSFGMARLLPAASAPPRNRLVVNVASSDNMYRVSSSGQPQTDAQGYVVNYLGDTLYCQFGTSMVSVSDGTTSYNLWRPDSALWGGAVRVHIDYSLVLAAVSTDGSTTIVADLDTTALAASLAAQSKGVNPSAFTLPLVVPGFDNQARYTVGLRIVARVTMGADGSLVATRNATLWSSYFRLRRNGDLFLVSDLRLMSVAAAAARFNVTVPVEDSGFPVVRLGGKVHVGVAASFEVSNGRSRYPLVGTGGRVWGGTVTARLGYTMGVIRVFTDTPTTPDVVPRNIDWEACIMLGVTESLRAAGAFTGAAAGRNMYLTFTLPSVAPAECDLLPPEHQNSTAAYAVGILVDIEIVDTASGTVLWSGAPGAVTPLFRLLPALPTPGGGGLVPGGSSSATGARSGALVQVSLVINVTASGSVSSVSRMVEALVNGSAAVDMRTAFSDMVGKPLDTVVIVAVVDHRTGRVYRFTWDSAANGGDGGEGVTATTLPRRRRLGGSDAPSCAAPDLSTSTLSAAATAGSGMTVVLGVYVPPPSCVVGGNATEADGDAATNTVDALVGAAINGAADSFAAAAAANLAVSAGVDSSTVSASLPSAGMVVDASLGGSANAATGGAGASSGSGSSDFPIGVVVGCAVGGVVVLSLLALAGKKLFFSKPVATAAATTATGGDAAAPAKLVTNPLTRNAAYASYNKISVA